MCAHDWVTAMEHAHTFEADQNWAAAEEAYRHAIELSMNFPLLQWRAYSDLHSLFGFLGREREALAAAHSASECARRDPIPAILSIALFDEARFHLKQNETEQATELLEEAFHVVQGELTNNQGRAYALVLRARCFLIKQELSKAEADLSAAWAELGPKARVSRLPGTLGVLAMWWATKAQIASTLGSILPAIAALREQVACCRLIAQAPQLTGPYKWHSLAIALRDLGVLLQKDGDISGATQALEESRSIQASIGLRPLDEGDMW
jgi:tetratricopeptide (TPR) repeat protein